MQDNEVVRGCTDTEGDICTLLVRRRYLYPTSTKEISVPLPYWYEGDICTLLVRRRYLYPTSTKEISVPYWYEGDICTLLVSSYISPTIYI